MMLADTTPPQSSWFTPLKLDFYVRQFIVINLSNVSCDRKKGVTTFMTTKKPENGHFLLILLFFFTFQPADRSLLPLSWITNQLAYYKKEKLSQTDSWKRGNKVWRQFDNNNLVGLIQQKKYDFFSKKQIKVWKLPSVR